MKIKHLSALALCSLALTFTACSDDDSVSTEAGRVYQYSTYVPNEDGTTELVLDSQRQLCLWRSLVVHQHRTKRYDRDWLSPRADHYSHGHRPQYSH